MTEYSFIDMHIHTIYSDEELCDMSIEELLEKAQKKAEKMGKDCLISIADHNSILGVKKARKLLSGGGSKYPNVKLINGIEFTTDLIEFAPFFDGHKLFTRCHTLAYGYNENDPELTAYSKVAHLHYSSSDNIGMQICAARRVICEKYNINIPFTVFESLTELTKKDMFKAEFLKIIQKYCQENKININMVEVDKIITPFISNNLNYNRGASAQGRLKLSEIAKLVKDAGGELVIAHPSLVRLNVSGLDYLAMKLGVNKLDIYDPANSKSGFTIDIGHVKNKKFLLNCLIESFEKICGYKISGLEKYYFTNFQTGTYTIIDEVCDEHGLYSTCGSDYHGEHLNPNKNIGYILHEELLKIYNMQFCSDTTEMLQIYVCELSAVEHLMNEERKNFAKNEILKLASGDVVKHSNLESSLKIMLNLKPKKHISNASIGEASKIDFSTRINELVEVAKHFDSINSCANDPRTQAKMMLKLNLFAENILLALIDLKSKVYRYEFIRSLPDYKQIIDILLDIRKRFNTFLAKNPIIIKNLRYDMKYYYNKKKLSIEQLANFSLLPPKEHSIEK